MNTEVGLIYPRLFLPRMGKFFHVEKQTYRVFLEYSERFWFNDLFKLINTCLKYSQLIVCHDWKSS